MWGVGIKLEEIVRSMVCNMSCLVVLVFIMAAPHIGVVRVPFLPFFFFSVIFVRPPPGHRNVRH